MYEVAPDVSFLVVNQFNIQGTKQPPRPDFITFVNSSTTGKKNVTVLRIPT